MKNQQILGKMKKMTVLLLAFAGMGLANAQQTLRLQDETSISISGTSTLHDWTMEAGSPKGSLEFDTGGINNVVLSIPVAEIVSERGATMDKKAHNALKMETVPEIRFITEVSKPIDLEDQVISGTLSIAGEDRSVEIPVIISGKGPIRIKGELPIMLADFSIEPPTAMFGSIVVGDQVTVHFDLLFAP